MWHQSIQQTLSALSNDLEKNYNWTLHHSIPNKVIKKTFFLNS